MPRIFADCWTAINDMHGFEARPVRGITTVSRCQAVCLSDSSCAAIDYDHNNTQSEYCWLLRNDLFPMIGPAPGVTHYVLDRNCTGKSQRFQFFH